MNNIRVFHAKSLGESHRKKNIPCQDAADTIEDRENGIIIAAVSDGHGSKQYLRSDRGSSLLVKIVLQTIVEFIGQHSTTLLSFPFTAIATRKSEIEQPETRKLTIPDIAFRRLFSSIIANWNEAVQADWNNDTPSIEQMQDVGVPESYIRLFSSGTDIEIAYGCTLIAFARTPDYWFAIQLGDGKCIAFDEQSNPWEPVPWDEHCIGNTTTSICESAALDNFRYCYGNDKMPVALFIGSDGMDGAYGAMDEFSVPLLAGLYESVIRSFAQCGFDNTVEEVRNMLPKLSEIGVTQDDMSLAAWIDLDIAKRLLPTLLLREIDRTVSQLSEKEKSLEKKFGILSMLKDQLTIKQSLYENKKKETDHAETEVNCLEKELLVIEKRLQDALELHTLLKSEVDKIENEIRDNSRQLDQTQAAIEKEENNKDELQNRVDRLKSEYELFKVTDEKQNS